MKLQKAQTLPQQNPKIRTKAALNNMPNVKEDSSNELPSSFTIDSILFSGGVIVEVSLDIYDRCAFVTGARSKIAQRSYEVRELSRCRTL